VVEGKEQKATPYWREMPHKATRNHYPSYHTSTQIPWRWTVFCRDTAQSKTPVLLTISLWSTGFLALCYLNYSRNYVLLNFS